MKKAKWIDYLFVSMEDEPFFVEVLESDGFEVAEEIAKNAFGDEVEFVDEFTPAEAEALDYDTY